MLFKAISPYHHHCYTNIKQFVNHRSITMTISGDQSAPLIVVVGATGLQGGSVINNLAASSLPYRMRGLTRNATKPKAKALADRGIEIVSCNLSPENKA